MIRVSVPGKVFILGEYGVLFGGAALLGAVRPCLSLCSTEQTSFDWPPGPSRRLYQMEGRRLKQSWTLLNNPLLGLGSSSAWFALLDSALYPEASIIDRIARYRYCSDEPHGEFLPSGADLVAHCLGGFQYYIPCVGAQPVSLDFDRYHLYAFRTPQKILSHEHLKKYREHPQSDIASLMALLPDVLFKRSARAFGQLLKDYQSLLIEARLCLEETKAYLLDLKDRLGITTAKGCGSMGADVLIVWAHHEERSRLMHWAHEKFLRGLDWSERGLYEENL